MIYGTKCLSALWFTLRTKQEYYKLRDSMAIKLNEKRKMVFRMTFTPWIHSVQ